ncbi:unnamed protein product, partial [marine sediment metagenome]
LTDEDLAAYPEYAEFKIKLASYLGIKEGNLLLTNATDEAISVIVQTYINEGDEVLIPVPSFAMFRFYAQVAGAKISEILYKNNLEFPTKKVLNKISKKTKLIVLCNPNNPTGTQIDKKDIIKILEKAKDSIVLVDEAYNQFSKESCTELIDDYENLIVIQTFSKAFGLGGLRLGYILSNDANIKDIGRVLSPYSVNSAAVKSASAALDDKEYIDWYVMQVLKGKKYVLEEFEKLKIKVYTTNANFFLAKFGKETPDIVAKLRQKG